MLKFIKSNLILNKFNIIILFLTPILIISGMVVLDTVEKNLEGIETIFLSLTITFSVLLITSDLKYSDFLLSLPTNRKKFVFYKYSSFFIYNITLFILLSLEAFYFFTLFNITLTYNIILQNIFLIISCILVISSLLIPINLFFFKQDNRAIMALNIFIPMLLPAIILNKVHLLNSYLVIIILLSTIVLNTISYIATIFFFKNYSI